MANMLSGIFISFSLQVFICYTSFAQENSSLDLSGKKINFHKLHTIDTLGFRLDLVKFRRTTSKSFFIPIGYPWPADKNASVKPASWSIYKCTPSGTVYKLRKISGDYSGITDYKILSDTVLLIYGNINAGNGRYKNQLSIDSVAGDALGSKLLLKDSLFAGIHFDRNGFISILNSDNPKKAWYIADEQRQYELSYQGAIDPATLDFSPLHISGKDSFAIISSAGKYELYTLQDKQLKPIAEDAPSDSLVYLARGIILAKKGNNFSLLEFRDNKLGLFTGNYNDQLIIEDSSILLYKDNEIAFWAPGMSKPDVVKTGKGKPYFFPGDKNRVLFVDTINNTITFFDLKTYSQPVKMDAHAPFFRDSIIPIWAETAGTGEVHYSFIKTGKNGIKPVIACMEIKKKELEISENTTYESGIYLRHYIDSSSRTIPLLLFTDQGNSSLTLLLKKRSSCAGEFYTRVKNVLETLPLKKSDPLFFYKTEKGWSAIDKEQEEHIIIDNKPPGKNLLLMDNVFFLPEQLWEPGSISFYNSTARGRLNYSSIAVKDIKQTAVKKPKRKK